MSKILRKLKFKQLFQFLVIFLMFCTTFNSTHCLHSLWFLFSMVKLFSINIVYKTVIFYCISCSRLQEYFENQIIETLLLSLQLCREAQFYRYFNDVRGWSGRGEYHWQRSEFQKIYLIFKVYLLHLISLVFIQLSLEKDHLLI